MANSLFDILSQKDFSEPPEATAIKAYIRDNFKASVEVIINDSDIIITTSSAALASTLRFRSGHLKQVARTEKRIILRIR